MTNYKSSKGIDYEYGDRMKRTIYDYEDRLNRKRLRTIKSNRNEVLYDNDTGRFIADDMTEKIWDAAIRVIRREMTMLDNIYYASNNEDYGKEDE
tara:strand:+ start:84 stop:368 length:285 start_codon:yes stop_codon:yes gene_type:complete